MRTLSLLWLLLLCLLTFFPTVLYAQAFLDTITVDLQLILPDDAIFFLNDLNLTRLENMPLIFTISIQNYFNAVKELTLHFGISKENDALIDGTTNPFNINPQPPEIYLTNQNIFAAGNQYSLQNFEIGDATENLTNNIVARGKLPPGIYRFLVEIDYQKDTMMQRVVIDVEEIYINEPTILDLISPGQPAESGEVMEIYTTLPLFQWHSNASQFRITVCEKWPTNTSPTDVMNNEPRLQQIVNNVAFYLYPPAGSWPLEEGKTYYWQVTAMVPSSSGPVELGSEIWGFRIGYFSGGTFLIQHQQILNLLISLFGESKIAELFGQGGELDGFIFTGVMLNNNQPMSQDDLLALIEKIRNNQIIIDGYAVE